MEPGALSHGAMAARCQLLHGMHGWYSTIAIRHTWHCMVFHGMQCIQYMVGIPTLSLDIHGIAWFCMAYMPSDTHGIVRYYMICMVGISALPLDTCGVGVLHSFTWQVCR